MPTRVTLEVGDRYDELSMFIAAGQRGGAQLADQETRIDALKARLTVLEAA